MSPKSCLQYVPVQRCVLPPSRQVSTSSPVVPCVRVVVRVAPVPHEHTIQLCRQRPSHHLALCLKHLSLETRRRVQQRGDQVRVRQSIIDARMLWPQAGAANTGWQGTPSWCDCQSKCAWYAKLPWSCKQLVVAPTETACASNAAEALPGQLLVGHCC
jgi:hypothetical protein